MNGNKQSITVDAAALQERDEFREQGWVKVVAPAKVNLHLAIGARRADGYHDAATVLHALNLHDTVYMRWLPGGGEGPVARMVSCEGVEAPDLASEDNIACKAVLLLAEKTGKNDETALELRIEKRIPAQAGLGGGSSDAAAALVGAARLWGLAPDDPAIEASARELGADVAFFIRGGCSYLEGTGDTFVRSLAPSNRSVVLVKPEGGVSTAAAYRAFDEDPQAIPAEVVARVSAARNADEVGLFNNLAPASERSMPQLAEIRSWLEGQAGVTGALLCGSGSCTFAVCDSFSVASAIAAEARKKGLWSRTTSFGSLRAVVAGK